MTNLIDLSELYQNRTGIYLGQPFIAKLYLIETKAVLCSRLVRMWCLYDNDYLLAKRKDYDKKTISVLLDLKGDTKKVMSVLRKDNHFVTAYPLSLFDKTKVVVVFKLPKVIRAAVHKFLEGKFSEMYDHNTLYHYGIKVKLPNTNRWNPIYTVFTKNHKDKDFVNIYRQRIFDTFGVDKEIDPNEELDSFFIKPTYELFNVDYTGIKQFV